MRLSDLQLAFIFPLESIDKPVLEPSSKIRHVSGPSLITSPACAGTKLIGTSGIGIPFGRVGMLTARSADMRYGIIPDGTCSYGEVVLGSSCFCCSFAVDVPRTVSMVGQIFEALKVLYHRSLHLGN